MKRITGTYVTISTVGKEKTRAFIPFPLPPDPPLAIGEDLQQKIDEALLSLGRLDSISILLPDISLFLYMYLRKEAVLSSQIEGTQSSLSDLLLFELDDYPGVPIDDVEEVSNYVAALNHGLIQLKKLPLSVRLIKEIHRVLLRKGRGSNRDPGEFRRSQNWIGGTGPGNAIFIPLPPDKITECMSDLEKYLHYKTPVLVKAALAHVQFETIHPFLDGNGRIGRLLITLLLCAEGVLRGPLLYLSLYFKAHRQTYYDLLQRVRVDGDWESWLSFFVEGVRETADTAVNTVKSSLELFDKDKKIIQANKKKASSALRIHAELQKNPISSIAKLAQLTELPEISVINALKELEKIGIVKEITGKQRYRLFAYDNYLSILKEGTEKI